jgi:large repetitive protein
VAICGAGTDSFTYNGDGDLASASGPSGEIALYLYGDGLVASETDAAGTTSYTYDGADRLSTETDPLTGATLTWAYNSDSDQVSVSYAADGTAGAGAVVRLRQPAAADLGHAHLRVRRGPGFPDVRL